MTAEHPFLETLNTRFGGILSHGEHEPDGHACALEAVNIARGNDWSDSPQAARMPDLRTLNDGCWTDDRERTDAMVPVILALWDWTDWGEERQVAFAKRVAERTIREIVPPVLRAIGLDAEADRCEREGTYDADAAAAARTAAYAVARTAAYAVAVARTAAYAATYAANAATYAATAAYAATYAVARTAAYAAAATDGSTQPLKAICAIFVECAAETAVTA